MERRDVVLGGGAAVLLLAAVLSLVSSMFYEQVVWKHFWGPIVADAANQATAVHGGVVAERGYTLVSEIGYGLLLAYALFVLVAVLDRLDIGRDRNFVLQFVPFIVAGGLLRVVEDAGVVAVPWRYLVISPIIYLTMFVAVLATVVAAVHLQRRYRIAAEQVVFGAGTAAALGLGGVLLAAETVAAAWMLPATLGLALVVFLPVVAVGRRVERLERLASWEGGTVMGGHLLDAAATALSLELLGYGEKHPVVAFFVEAAGTAYAFILLKVAVIGGIVVVMDDEMRADDPLFFNLVLLGILAVGLGPGTRNLVRAVLGI